MENSKLLKVLRSFSRKELTKFDEFLRSPYFNKNENVIGLFSELKHSYPKFTGERVLIENIFSRVYPNQKYDYNKISNLNSDLYQLAKSFLKLTAYEKKGVETEIDLLNELHERKLDIPYSQTDKEISKKLNSSMVKDEHYYSLQHNLNRLNTSHYKFDKSKYSFNSIQIEFNSFLQYSLAGLLRHYSKMLHNRNHGNINFDMQMLDQVLDYIKDKDFQESPSCQLYKQIILLELNRDEKNYNKLLSLKAKYSENFSDIDMYYLLLVINSFAVHRLKLGDETYYKDRYLSLREINERNYFSSDILFMNFITTFTSACLAGDLEWAEKFKQDFKDGIVPLEETDNTINYCDAFLAFHKKDYNTALNLFAQTNFKLFLAKVMVKSHMIRIFYEESLHEQTLTAIDAFRHYLKSEKLISDVQKEAHYEFLAHLHSLTRIKLESDKKNRGPSLALLKKQVSSMESNSMGMKNWLLKKLDEFST